MISVRCFLIYLIVVYVLFEIIQSCCPPRHTETSHKAQRLDKVHVYSTNQPTANSNATIAGMHQLSFNRSVVQPAGKHKKYPDSFRAGIIFQPYSRLLQ